MQVKNGSFNLWALKTIWICFCGKKYIILINCIRKKMFYRLLDVMLGMKLVSRVVGRSCESVGFFLKYNSLYFSKN